MAAREGCLNVGCACSPAARGLFAIEVDDGGGFLAATASEVDAALRGGPVRRGQPDDRDDVDVG